MNEEERTLEEEIDFLRVQIGTLKGAIEGWRTENERLQAVVEAARSYLSHPVIDGMAVDYWDYKRLQEAVRALDGESCPGGTGRK